MGGNESCIVMSPAADRLAFVEPFQVLWNVVPAFGSFYMWLSVRVAIDFLISLDWCRIKNLILIINGVAIMNSFLDIIMWFMKTRIILFLSERDVPYKK